MESSNNYFSYNNHLNQSETYDNDDDIQLHLLQQLQNQFADYLDAEIVESVFFECKNDFELSRKNLADMMGINLKTEKSSKLTAAQVVASPGTPKAEAKQQATSTNSKYACVQYAQKGYRTIIIFRGLPGSGKSTLALKLLDEIIGPCNPRDYLFSADDYFVHNGVYLYNYYQLRDAHEWAQKKAYHAMIQGLSPILVDNTNTQLWEIKPYAIWAVQNGYQIFIEESGTSWQFNASQLARRNKHNVPKEKILDMLDRYDRNITVERLFVELGLQYGDWKPPVVRNVPPVTNRAERNLLITRGNRSSCGFLKKRDVSTSMDEKSDNCLIITARGRFENCGQLPPKYPKEGFFDKGTFTDDPVGDFESTSGKEVKDMMIDSLQDMFPSVPRVSLEELLHTCGGDVDWCMNLLLEDPKVIFNSSQIPPLSKKPITSEKAVVESCVSNDLVSIEIKPTRNEEEFRKVKKYVESNIVINPSHYGPNTSKLKGIAKTELYDEAMGRPSNAHDESFVMIDADQDLDDSISECSEAIGSEEQEDDTVELNLGSSLVEQLNLLFGDLGIKLPGFFSPIVEIPRQLAKQLHALYYESICKQIDAQQLQHEQMLAEDEEMQMKLQMEEIRMMEEELNATSPSLKQIMKDQQDEQRTKRMMDDQWKNLTPQDMAYKMTIQKLSASFPKIHNDLLIEMYLAHWNKFDDTVTALRDSGAEYVDNVKKILSATTLQEMQAAHDVSKDAEEQDRCGFEDRDPTSAELREEAARQQAIRVELLNKAKQYYNKGMTEVATFYSELAQKQTRMWEKYNSMAAVQIVNEGFHRSNKADTIDLHFLRVKEALNALDIYIDEVIDQLRTLKTNRKDIFVITGRGKNSVNGIARIRPAVEQRLKKRNIKFNRINCGLLKVKVNQTALVTAELPN